MLLSPIETILRSPTGSVSGSDQAGGLVGNFGNGSISNSYATSMVTGSGGAVGDLYNMARSREGPYGGALVLGSTLTYKARIGNVDSGQSEERI